MPPVAATSAVAVSFFRCCTADRKCANFQRVHPPVVFAQNINEFWGALAGFGELAVSLTDVFGLVFVGQTHQLRAIVFVELLELKVGCCVARSVAPCFQYIRR